MTLAELVIRGTKGSLLGVVVPAALAGISNTAAIVIVNGVAQAPTRATLLDFAEFAATVVLSLVSARHTSQRLISAIETSLHQLKVQMIDKVRQTPLVELEQIGASEIFDRLNQNIAVVSLAASLLGVLMQSTTVFLLALVYLVWLSPVVFGLLAPLVAAGILIYRIRQREIIAWINRRFTVRLQFFDRLMDLIRGAKEIKLHRARADDVREHFEDTSAELRDLSATVTQRWDDNQLFLSTNLFLTLAVLVFVLPQYVELEADLLSQLIVALMFAWGSVQGSIFGYTKYVEANRALDQLAKLEAKLDGGVNNSGFNNSDFNNSGFDGGDLDDDDDDDADEFDGWVGVPGRIELRDVQYRYPASNGEPGFGLGPIDLHIDPGEILFIVGGNGAGKSTLLKLLTGLYTPQQGALSMGGVFVGPQNIAAYRELLSVILTDVHLFQRAYGLLDADPSAAAELLAQLKIAHKTALVRGRFTELRLSTGQRKRLAMVLALLEDRPILVLDEWAADQDPEFRSYFYEHMLPSLKRQGKTVIAVSHDDRYFHCADRVIVLDYGQIRSG